MGEMLVVGSKVKAYIKSKGCHTSSDAIAALSAKVEDMLNAATQRCKGNKRSTVKPQDL
jgi:histone H3/H4